MSQSHYMAILPQYCYQILTNRNSYMSSNGGGNFEMAGKAEAEFGEETEQFTNLSFNFV
jgi:hypothetical protein